VALRGLAAFSRGDLEESIAEIHPEIEWHIAFRLPDLPAGKEVYRGHDEVLTVWRSFRSAWDELTIEMEEVLLDEPDVIVMRVRFRGKGQASGIEVDRALYYVMRMREGRLAFTKTFEEADQALAAAKPPDGD